MRQADGRRGSNRGLALLALLQAAACARTGFVAPPDPCLGVTCGGHGVCAADPAQAPRCRCDPGYALREPITCAPTTTLLDAGGVALDGAPDAATADTMGGEGPIAVDGTPADLAAADSMFSDSMTADSTTADQAPADTSVVDRVLAEVGVADSVVADRVVGDSVIADSLLVDTAGGDALVEDGARVDAAGSVPWAPGLLTWQYRKRLRIPARAPAALLVEFPLLVTRTDVDLRDRALSNGFDLRFTDVAGNLLEHQRERYDGASGALIAWVKLPAYNSTDDTILYLYYGGDPGSPDPSVTTVWSNGFAGVWHLDELADGTAGEYLDSSGNGHHASSAGSMPSMVPAQVAGQISGGQDLDGRNDFVTTGTSLLSGASSLTLSTWSYLRAAGGGLVGQNDVLEMGFFWADRLNVWSAAIDGLCPGKSLTSLCTPDFPLDAWFHAAVTWDGGEVALFVDGVEKHRLPLATIGSSGDPFNIGGEIFDPSGGLLDGVVDEVHVATVARPPAWLALEHANQLDPAACVLFGPEEPRP